MRLAVLPQYTPDQLIRSFSQKAVHEEQQQSPPAAGMVFYTSSGK